MSVTASSLGTNALPTAWLHFAQLHSSSPIDTTCNVSEVRRLLWSVLTLAVAAGGYSVARPNWRRAGGLAATAIVWLWIDMEGPVLVDLGGRHGVHFADLPVIVALLASGATAVRMMLQRARRYMTTTP